MKIGLVCPYNVAKGGGVQELIFAMQAELQSRGHEAYVITPRPRDYDVETAKHKNIILVGSATDFNSPLHTTIQVSASLNDDIEHMLEEHKFDILHFHEPWVPVLSRQILTRSNTINVATFHAKLPETMMSRTVAKVVTPYTKPLLKYIHEFTAVSDAAAEYVCSLTDQPVAIIPNGIDLAGYKVPARRSDRRKHKTILFVGRLENRKGVKHLIHAFHLLQEKDPNVSLIIAGDGPEREKLEMLVDDLALKNVTFAGYISDKDKKKYMRSADLFVAPALYGESFGIVLLEAMASGLVTVAGNNPGYSSVMQGLGGLSLVDPKDSAEFARRIHLLLHEADLRVLWRDWAKNEIAQYSYPNVVSQYEEIYQQALQRYEERE
jgi:phosphatidyl-myo-inositol alpha-mannosyltransferase